MRITSCLLLLSFSLLSVPIEAKQGETADNSKSGIRNGFSVTTSYLPTRYPLWDFDAAKWTSTTVNGFGAGLEYNLSVPLSQSNWVFRTGVGCTYSRIDETGDKTLYEYSFFAPGQSTTTISGSLPLPLSFNAYCKTQREYIYAYLPIEIGYKLNSKGDISVIPFLGLQGKYNIGFTERGYVESATWKDHYFELFDESSVESNAERFMFQIKAGFKVEYDKLFCTLSFTRDKARMFKDALVKSTNNAYWGPYSFNCWQLGFGINF